MQPVSRTAHVGDSVGFDVTASGTGPLSYQWYKSIMGINIGDLVDNGGTIKGAQTSKLWIFDVIDDYACGYSVRVRNSCGTVHSSEAWLTVVPNVYNVASGPSCSVELDGSDVGVDYQLVMLQPALALLDIVHGTGAPISFGVPSGPGLYTVAAGFADPYCVEEILSDCFPVPMAGTAEVVAVEVDWLTAACGSTNSIVLDWSLSGVSSSSCITGFVIKRSTTHGGPYTVIHIAGSNDRHYVDTTVVPGVTYYYVVTIQSGTCESPPSDEDYSSTCTDCSTPFYEPAYWNDGGVIQNCNNCYNYANNVRTDTFAQPGYASGTWCRDNGCKNAATIYQYALNDGLLASSKDAVCPDGMTKVALFIWPSVDYHWYRQDANGNWTHKMGNSPASSLDNSLRPITDPENANRGYYTDLAGYLCTCSDFDQGKGHARINGEGCW
jgi:hypothetical protein